MNRLFDQLNLRPQERRLVMLAMVVLFGVINLWLVFPRFNDWRELRQKLIAATETYERRAAEAAKLPEYKAKLEQLQSEGQFIPPEDQSASLMEIISREAAVANISLTKIAPGGGGPIPNNPFFEEQRVTLNGIAAEADLVNFLRNLGNHPALLRVRDMTLKPDASGTKLAVDLTIAGNYPKKAGPRPKPGFRTPVSLPKS
jgi:Tfp pilus assembly protein PilO